MIRKRVTTISVVDHGTGNRRSVCKALEHLGAHVTLTADPEAVAHADGVVLPGVGAFPAAMAALAARDLVEPIREVARAGRPLLGICLGMQLLFDRSHEHGETAGLGLIPGTVTRIDVSGDRDLRVPHIGWNEVRFVRDAPLTAGLPSTGAPFYHVHSYAVRPDDPEDVVGTTTYGETFATIVARGNVMGTQFHPEKSSTHGLALLEAFAAHCALAPA